MTMTKDTVFSLSVAADFLPLVNDPYIFKLIKAILSQQNSQNSQYTEQPCNKALLSSDS